MECAHLGFLRVHLCVFTPLHVWGCMSGSGQAFAGVDVWNHTGGSLGVAGVCEGGLGSYTRVHTGTLPLLRCLG